MSYLFLKRFAFGCRLHWQGVSGRSSFSDSLTDADEEHS